MKKITWTSSDSKIAKVSSKGKVTAVAGGTATITAKNTYGKKATCKVTVKKPYTVSKITYTVSYDTNPNGSAKFARIYLTVHLTNIDSAFNGGIDVSEVLRSNDYTYKNEPKVNYFAQTQKSIAISRQGSTGTAFVPSRAYCILYGGTSGTTPTTYTVTCAGKSYSIALPYRAASFTPGGYFNTN